MPEAGAPARPFPPFGRRRDRVSLDREDLDRGAPGAGRRSGRMEVPSAKKHRSGAPTGKERRGIHGGQRESGGSKTITRPPPGPRAFPATPGDSRSRSAGGERPRQGRRREGAGKAQGRFRRARPASPGHFPISPARSRARSRMTPGPAGERRAACPTVRCRTTGRDARTARRFRGPGSRPSRGSARNRTRASTTEWVFPAAGAPTAPSTRSPSPPNRRARGRPPASPRRRCRPGVGPRLVE